ncbi:uncharacterized protein IL334_004838 [Kwoniella shivajii]|uniref:Uncharacterized protein n=1 Tax=Kwoniella shivajii TaxID=564305 RepID=A0ABZ1D3C2_9TREE|nr:hypothetical protein IL334_004838 [Kwoniella shivajii]
MSSNDENKSEARSSWSRLRNLRAGEQEINLNEIRPKSIFYVTKQGSITMRTAGSGGNGSQFGTYNDGHFKPFTGQGNCSPGNLSGSGLKFGFDRSTMQDLATGKPIFCPTNGDGSWFWNTTTGNPPQTRSTPTSGNHSATPGAEPSWDGRSLVDILGLLNSGEHPNSKR